MIGVPIALASLNSVYHTFPFERDSWDDSNWDFWIEQSNPQLCASNRSLHPLNKTAANDSCQLSHALRMVVATLDLLDVATS